MRKNVGVDCQFVEIDMAYRGHSQRRVALRDSETPIYRAA